MCNFFRKRLHSCCIAVLLLKGFLHSLWIVFRADRDFLQEVMLLYLWHVIKIWSESDECWKFLLRFSTRPAENNKYLIFTIQNSSGSNRWHAINFMFLTNHDQIRGKFAMSGYINQCKCQNTAFLLLTIKVWIDFYARTCHKKLHFNFFNYLMVVTMFRVS